MKVIMFKANDGQLFETQALCIAHNSELKLRPELESFVRSNSVVLFGTETPMADDVDAVVNMLVANAGFLRSIFKEEPVETRGRKSKTVPAPETPVAA